MSHYCFKQTTKKRLCLTLTGTLNPEGLPNDFISNKPRNLSQLAPLKHTWPQSISNGQKRLGCLTKLRRSDQSLPENSLKQIQFECILYTECIRKYSKHDRIKYFRCLLVFKSLHGLAPSYVSNLILPLSPVHNRCTRGAVNNNLN